MKARHQARRRKVLRLLSLAVTGFMVLSCQSSPKPVQIGMTVHSRGADAANIERQFDIMTDMNVKWVRVDIGWAWIETERGQFDWAYTDKVVSEATAHGMNVLAVLATTPAWARSSVPGHSGISAYSRPVRLSSLADFARIAAERYAPRGVHSWEIWNEPNMRKFWPPRPDAGEYGALFRAIAEVIRSVDPAATLLIGGLSPRYDLSPTETSPVDYLEQLYRNGSAQLADAVAAHPYSFPAMPMESPQRMIGGFKDLPALYDVMAKHGDGRKKIWITEFGAPTGTGQYAVSENDQAASIVQAREQLERWDWSGPLIYYELVDGGTDLNEPEENFGVLRDNLEPKPAAIALMRAASGTRE
ncbi:beta-galactosidase [Mycobacterium sp. IS-1590]|uniref:cellulase family glycosylhydrolase n=1 Tax=Mycobacterium sp. IS-1590 TaxID=1772286 RepID=UPI00074A8CF0|nr:cellulase family glycosylhydrolase [Mycobacterium sp. IS-1590]KUI43262.1 beta-galactosidase [Mycobacterium sp. IS-1590]